MTTDQRADADSPLVIACRDGKVSNVRTLLDHGADIAKADTEGRTPLHVAAAKGYAAIVALLIATGATASAVDKTGATALHDAAKGGHAETIKQLARACDVNHRDHNGSTALHWAALRGKYTAVQALLALDADREAVTNDGQTALHLVCTGFRLPTARVLLQAGVNSRAIDLNGQSALHLSLSWSDDRRTAFEKLVPLIRLLISFGATWDVKCDALVSSRDVNVQALGVCAVCWAQERTDGVSFTDVPFETLELGPEATNTYIRELKLSKQVVSRRKICLVGPSKAGKTSLAKSMTSRTPCLEHNDDRTIGIDQFEMRFVAESGVADRVQVHDVTFWDFAGQNEYQVAHSLFYSRRRLYLVCIDLEAFLVAHMQATLMTDNTTQMQRLMNEFVEGTILRWIRSIFALQPEAEFVFVATKDDLLNEPQQFTDVVRQDLVQSLLYVQGIVAEMQIEFRKHASLNPYSTASRSIHGYQTTVGTVPSRSDLPLVFVSCEHADSVLAARAHVEELIVSSHRSFDMPDSYSRVLATIVDMRTFSASKPTSRRVGLTFRPVDPLVEELTTVSTPAKTCKEILRVLHDLGDVLWYEELGVAYFKETVVLDPMLLIDFVRQVISHKLGVDTLPHDTLKGLPFWVNVDDQNQMLALKETLQKFQLAHATEGHMRWDSDLIVPAFWRSNTPASWLFGGERVLLGPPTMRVEEDIRVQWEYHFTVEFPTSLFDHLVVASYSPFLNRCVGPDWILYHELGVYSCRIMVSRDLATHQRTLCLEAAIAADASVAKHEELWDAFQVLSMSLVQVLRRYPGLLITSFALDEAHERKRLESLLVFPPSTRSRTWMPCEKTWRAYKEAIASTYNERV